MHRETQGGGGKLHLVAFANRLDPRNALDVIARADDAFLAANGLGKGAMTLIDEARAEALYGLMGPGRESSGGSAGNTIAGLASLGGKAAYIGLVRDDVLRELISKAGPAKVKAA